MERVKVGLVGFGTVGASFYRLMTANGELLQDRLGAAVELKVIAEKDTAKVGDSAARKLLVSDYRKIIADPQVSVVVELVGGTGVAHEIIRAALEAGKHVISANKALLALRGDELFALARHKSVELKFEAAVCGGIPIVKIVQEGLVGNRISKIMGIVNGTSNFILTQMRELGLSFEEALKAAQAKGFAEADPSLDVGGGDSAHKISLLAGLAFGGWVDYRQILVEGITTVTPGEIQFASSAGFAIKLVASAMLVDGRPSVTVFPALVPAEHPLAAVRNEVNAVFVECDYLGPGLFLGKGAGGDPTASSVASDLGDLVRSAKSKASSPGMSIDPSRRLPLHPYREIQYRFFYHFITENRPGIWAAVTGRLADNGINIESVHQKWEDRKLPSDLYILVDEAPEHQARKALEEVSACPGIRADSRYYRILPL
jgi:homoserine dehydrogenase